jgi:hypothetical protein
MFFSGAPPRGAGLAACPPGVKPRDHRSLGSITDNLLHHRGVHGRCSLSLMVHYACTASMVDSAVAKLTAAGMFY